MKEVVDYLTHVEKEYIERHRVGFIRSERYIKRKVKERIREIDKFFEFLVGGNEKPSSHSVMKFIRYLRSHGHGELAKTLEGLWNQRRLKLYSRLLEKTP